MATADVYNTVNSHYSALARSNSDDITHHSQKVALSFGYDADELAAIPEGANLGVSCGNPLAVAGLRPVS
jgi:arsenite methyltransferase